MNHAAANLIDPGAAKRYQAVPISFTDDGVLIVAMADPSDGLGINDIAVMTKLEVRPAVASKSDIEALRARSCRCPRSRVKQAPPVPVVEPAEGEGRSTRTATRARRPSHRRPTSSRPRCSGSPTARAARRPPPSPLAPGGEEQRARLDEEHQRKLEELKQEYESKLRHRSRPASCWRSWRPSAPGATVPSARSATGFEAEKSELERAIRNLEGGIETRRKRRPSGPPWRCAPRWRNEKATLEQSLRELRTDLEGERYQSERALGEMRAELEREREQHKLGVEELTGG